MEIQESKAQAFRARIVVRGRGFAAGMARRPAPVSQVFDRIMVADAALPRESYSGCRFAGIRPYYGGGRAVGAAGVCGVLASVLFRWDAAHLTRMVVLDCLEDLVAGVHDEGAVPGDGFADRPAAEQHQLHGR